MASPDVNKNEGVAKTAPLILQFDSWNARSINQTDVGDKPSDMNKRWQGKNGVAPWGNLLNRVLGPIHNSKAPANTLYGVLIYIQFVLQRSKKVWMEE